MELGWRKIPSNAERTNRGHVSFAFVSPHPTHFHCPVLAQWIVPKDNHLIACQQVSYFPTLFLKLTSDFLATLQNVWVDSSPVLEILQEEVINREMGTTMLYSDPNSWIPCNFSSKCISPRGSAPSVTQQEAPTGKRQQAEQLHTHVLRAKIHLSLSSRVLGFLKQRRNACLPVLYFSVAQRVAMRLASQWWYKLSLAGALACACCLWSRTCLIEHCLHPCPELT